VHDVFMCSPRNELHRSKRRHKYQGVREYRHGRLRD
jgi:hypothetical protein